LVSCGIAPFPIPTEQRQEREEQHTKLGFFWQRESTWGGWWLPRFRQPPAIMLAPSHGAGPYPAAQALQKTASRDRLVRWPAQLRGVSVSCPKSGRLYSAHCDLSRVWQALQLIANCTHTRGWGSEKHLPDNPGGCKKQTGLACGDGFKEPPPSPVDKLAERWLSLFTAQSNLLDTL
jgi:hypothetical protein